MEKATKEHQTISKRCQGYSIESILQNESICETDGHETSRSVVTGELKFRKARCSKAF